MWSLILDNIHFPKNQNLKNAKYIHKEGEGAYLIDHLVYKRAITSIT